jgi:hypothetical protein
LRFSWSLCLGVLGMMRNAVPKSSTSIGVAKGIPR